MIMLLLAAAMGGFAWFMGLPAMAQQEFSNLARNAGFEVRKVEVRGIERMDELPVYAIALGQHERAMPSVDLASLRAQVMQLGRVEEARSEEHTSELQSLMRTSYAVFCLKKKKI